MGLIKAVGLLAVLEASKQQQEFLLAHLSTSEAYEGRSERVRFLTRVVRSAAAVRARSLQDRPTVLEADAIIVSLATGCRQAVEAHVLCQRARQGAEAASAAARAASAAAMPAAAVGAASPAAQQAVPAVAPAAAAAPLRPQQQQQQHAPAPAPAAAAFAQAAPPTVPQCLPLAVPAVRPATALRPAAAVPAHGEKQQAPQLQGAAAPPAPVAAPRPPAPGAAPTPALPVLLTGNFVQMAQAATPAPMAPALEALLDCLRDQPAHQPLVLACETIQEALTERSASAGLAGATPPVASSPVLAHGASEVSVLAAAAQHSSDGTGSDASTPTGSMPASAGGSQQEEATSSHAAMPSVGDLLQQFGTKLRLDQVRCGSGAGEVRLGHRMQKAGLQTAC